jgi:hypothetical protein
MKLKERNHGRRKKLNALRIFLRIYGILSFAIFGPLCIGIVFQSPLLADGGPMNWTIWNGVLCVAIRRPMNSRGDQSPPSSG